jgi:AbrB family looped-hinge helix DNA binding protein
VLEDFMRVTEKGQVTIPRRIRERLGVRPGMQVRFREVNHRVVLEKIGHERSPFQDLYGLLGTPQKSDRLLRQLRGA